MKVLKIRFGGVGERVDAHGIRFYGDVDKRAYNLGYISEIISDREEAPFTTHKRITLWYIFEKIRPFNRIMGYLEKLIDALKAEGYTIVISSLDELVDTTSPEYAGRPERRFPAPDRMRWYNAASGFSITAEKSDAKSGFSVKEIETVQEEAMKLSREIYGNTLKKMERQP